MVPASLFLVLLLLSSPDFVEPSFLGLGRSLAGVNVNVPARSYTEKARESLGRRRHFMSSLSESTEQGLGEIKNLPFKVLGVAGGIGSGKSTVCRLLEDLGCLAHIGESSDIRCCAFEITLDTDGTLNSHRSAS
jgi:Dephospho-CoA kinase